MGTGYASILWKTTSLKDDYVEQRDCGIILGFGLIKMTKRWLILAKEKQENHTHLTPKLVQHLGLHTLGSNFKLFIVLFRLWIYLNSNIFHRTFLLPNRHTKNDKANKSFPSLKELKPQWFKDISNYSWAWSRMICEYISIHQASSPFACAHPSG